MSYYAKITSKGQVTIPKPIRDELGSDVVEFAVMEDCITIRAVRRVGGRLRRFAAPDQIPAETQAWQTAVGRRYENR